MPCHESCTGRMAQRPVCLSPKRYPGVSRTSYTCTPGNWVVRGQYRHEQSEQRRCYFYCISQSCPTAEDFFMPLYAYKREQPAAKNNAHTKAQNRRKYKTIIMEIMGSFKPWGKQNRILCVFQRRRRVLKIHLLSTLKATWAFSSWPYITSKFSSSCSTLQSSIVIRGKTNSSSELKSCRGKL